MTVAIRDRETGRVDAWMLRHRIYQSFVERGRAPTRDELDELTGSPVATSTALRELHDRHAIVVDDAGHVQMALPFSSVPTDHLVVAGVRSWWANCAWDALAIPLLLGIDARLEAEWLDTGAAVDLTVSEGDLSSTDGWVHFALPARHWWDDIVET